MKGALRMWGGVASSVVGLVLPLTVEMPQAVAGLVLVGAVGSVFVAVLGVDARERAVLALEKQKALKAKRDAVRTRLEPRAAFVSVVDFVKQNPQPKAPVFVAIADEFGVFAVARLDQA